ncbi:hypothetical protein CAPTEDRAFT_21356 [Capitella teleta]|uniref:Profilin n=1 Tax=Capitella teleta TaxID=283909 RepID=R7UX83_CAPTE|nr:hypothetical protein CAPTEDRAFT_21356 [Capitella teleta]|eukprot:ELU10907.1 hypothetical protein CAPTEDRAFT_21356 [Capitella teleta]
MSWDDYITTLTGSGQVSMGAICSFDGTPWAKSANFNLTPAEVQSAFGAFSNPDSLRASGHSRRSKILLPSVR